MNPCLRLLEPGPELMLLKRLNAPAATAKAAKQDRSGAHRTSSGPLVRLDGQAFGFAAKALMTLLRVPEERQCCGQSKRNDLTGSHPIIRNQSFTASRSRSISSSCIGQQ